MFIELHLLQNFGPSNLNRNDTNAPKDCTFGGFRRSRISSQCIKRSIRRHEAFTQAVLDAGGNLGSRTKRIAGELADRLATPGRTPQEAVRVVKTLLGSIKLSFDKKSEKGADEDGPNYPKTEYLLFLSESEIEEITKLADQQWDALLAAELPNADESDEESGKKKVDKKKAKKDATKAAPKEVLKALEEILHQPRRLAADIALFGRMVADGANMNINAACQVAHALSTNEMSMEMDFFTAVDDLLPNGETGADMLGIVEFNSACYYRYAQVNLGILAKNLNDKPELVRAAIRGFLLASAAAVPTGMQNSMAAHNPPSYLRVLVRSQGAPWSLANAFLKPVRTRPGDKKDLVGQSVERLEDYLGKLKGAYGAEGFELDCTLSLAETAEAAIPLQALVKQVDDYLAAQVGQ